MRLALVLTMMLAAAVVTEPASASGGGHSPKKKTETAEAVPEGPRVPSVYMPTLVAPMVVRGELYHYVFLSVTLELTSESHKGMMLEKIPYIQDAFLRDVHGATLAKDNDPAVLDQEGLKVRLLAVASRVVGPNIVQGIVLRDVAQAQH